MMHAVQNAGVENFYIKGAAEKAVVTIPQLVGRNVKYHSTRRR